MRKLWVLFAAVFAMSIIAVGVQAATSSKSKTQRYSTKSSAKRKAMSARSARGPKVVCYTPKARKAKRVVRRSRPATVARGPSVTCPAPVVNVPQQPAPVVNVPEGPAPVVNVAAPPPGVAVTVDNCNIYIVQGSQLMVLDKNTYCLKQSVPITGSAAGTTGAGPMLPSTQPGIIQPDLQPSTIPSQPEMQPSTLPAEPSMPSAAPVY